MNTLCQWIVPFLLMTGFSLAIPGPALSAPAYVGSAKCGECHQDQYQSFQQHSKKAHSWKNVAIMAPKLSPSELQGCYACHTTGYGQGGFVDYQSSPHLADVGCETCHGPGAAHAEAGDPALVQRKPAQATCARCHDNSRTKSFKRSPLTYSGAH